MQRPRPPSKPRGPSVKQIREQEAAALEEYERDRELMAALDTHTRVPHLLIELRSLGYIEICGKDMGGIHGRLESWMEETWGCERMTEEVVKVPNQSAFEFQAWTWEQGFMLQERPYAEHNRLSDLSLHWRSKQGASGCLTLPGCGQKVVTQFRMRGNDGENNMGKLTMELISFMTNSCGWGLKLLNGTNLGFHGQIREQQIKFKAPHPLNLIAPHLMIELRQVGYIEINGPDTNGIYKKLEEWLAKTWKAKRVKADPQYCDLKFSCAAFKRRGTEGENNMGMRTMEIVDFMVQTCVWTMITCNGGNYGRYGDIREQQLVFRDDGHVQHGEDHIMIELRDVGFVEVCGLSSTRDIEPFVDSFLRESWLCEEYVPRVWEAEKYCDRKYSASSDLFYKDGLTNNIGKLTLELAGALATQGWMLMLCNGGHTSRLKVPTNTTPRKPWRSEQIEEVAGQIKREQQIKFTRAREGERADEPLLMIELRAVPSPPPLIKEPSFGSKLLSLAESRKLRDWIASARFDGIIEVNGLNTNGVYQKLEAFIEKFMQGKALGPTQYCDCLFMCSSLRQKMSPHNEFWDGYYCGANNLGKYSMRLCDFLVDHLGEWDLIVCNGNAAERAWRFGTLTSLVAREVQLVFRHRSGGRPVFMSASAPQVPLGRPPLHAPEYWKEGSREGRTPSDVVAVTDEEKQWLQELLDGTYIKRVTRDRRGGALADRFVVVAAVRSEHPAHWDAFAKKRAAVGDSMPRRTPASCRHWADGKLPVPKTMAACPDFAKRCGLPDEGGNLANEAWLFHGTNPTSAVAILRSNFKVDLAGASAGTMFGPGVYLAEASSKSDEYAQSDSDGAHKGLFAIVVCRAVVGRPYAVEQPGNHMDRVLSGDFDCVLGDREKAVGTFREFIFFSEDAIYPEIAVFYRREGGADSKSSTSPPATATSGPATAPRVGEGDMGDVGDSEVPMAMPGRRGELQVVIPKGYQAGSSFSFQTPQRTLAEAEVPRGYHPGSILTVRT